MGSRTHRPAARAALAAVVTMFFTMAAADAAAQPSLDITFGRAVNTLTTSDRQTTGGTIDLQQKLADGRVRLYYSLEGGDYTTPGDWAYFAHDFGATWQPRKADATGPSIFAGVSGVFRSNGASWEAADYRGLGLFVNAEWKPAETKAIRAGYRLDLRRFPDTAVLNQVEHEGFGSVLLNLPTRTTVIGEAQVGAKRYDVLDPTVAQASSMDPPAFHVGAGNGRGVGAMARSWGYLTGSVASAAVGGTAGQVTVLGRIAQSLADRTGFTLQYSHRSSFGALPTAVITTPALFFDDGVYDDPFASNANSVRASVKQILHDGMEVQVFGAWTRKDYRGTLALDLDGVATADLRQDRIQRAGAAWTIPLFRERTGSMDLGLVLDYQFTRHQSNDVYYNYASHGFGVGFTASY